MKTNAAGFDILVSQSRIKTLIVRQRNFILQHTRFSRRDGPPVMFAGIFVFCLLALCLVGEIEKKVSSSQGQIKAQAGKHNIAEATTPRFAGFAGFSFKTVFSGYSPTGREVVRSRIMKEPDSLKNLTISEVAHLFKSIDFRRQVGDSHMWQFQSDICVLDVYFSEIEGLEFPENKIAHYDIRSRTKTSLVKASGAKTGINIKENIHSHCLQSILESRKQQERSVALSTKGRIG